MAALSLAVDLIKGNHRVKSLDGGPELGGGSDQRNYRVKSLDGDPELGD